MQSQPLLEYRHCNPVTDSENQYKETQLPFILKICLLRFLCPISSSSSSSSSSSCSCLWFVHRALKSMLRVGGSVRSGDHGRYAPPFAPSSSSSTLSPLAPPFNVDRFLPAFTNLIPNSPPPASKNTLAPYFIPSVDPVWSCPSPSSSILTNLNSGFRSVGGSRCFPSYYPPAPDLVNDNMESASNYKGYVGGWNGAFDLEEGRLARGSMVNSSWIDSLTSCQMPPDFRKRGTAENFSVYEDSFGSWHGAHNELSSYIGHVGSELSEWLDDSHREIYVEKSRGPTDGSGVAEIDVTAWPNHGSSYFSTSEISAVVKDRDTIIPGSYDRYISQLISCSRDPLVHYPAQTSSSRQAYAPSIERNESLLTCNVLKHGNSVINHANLQTTNDDYAGYINEIQNEIGIYENAEGKEDLERISISGDLMQNNSGASCSSLPAKGLSSDNSSVLGVSIDCLQDDVNCGFNVANLSFCNTSNFERSAFIPKDSLQTSDELPDHLIVGVDSPCWKGASVSHRYSFNSNEILEPVVVSLTNGDDVAQGHNSLKIQSDIEQDGIFVCNETGKDNFSATPKNLSPVTDFLGSDIKLEDITESESNYIRIENAAETEQLDNGGDHITVLIEQDSVPQGSDDFVRQSCQAENVVCEAISSACEAVPTVKSSHFEVNHIPSLICNGEMNLASLNVSLPAELKKVDLLETSSNCLSQGKDVHVFVKAMLSLSEVLLSHYCNNDEAWEESELKTMQQVIDNLEAVILQYKKSIAGSSSHVPRAAAAAEAQRDGIKESTVDSSSNKNSKDAEENVNAMSSETSIDQHDITAKSSSANLEESDGVVSSFSKALESGFTEDSEEHPKILLYKNLWVQTEATLCSLKHDIALMKLEMGSLKSHIKGKSQLPSSGSSEPAMGTPPSKFFEHITESCKDDDEAENNHVLKEDKIDASVFARFRVLKDRDGEASGPPPPPNTAATNAVVPFHSTGDCKGASDGSVMQAYCHKSHAKWLFSSGSDSPSSEWEHVLKDEFTW